MNVVSHGGCVYESTLNLEPETPIPKFLNQSQNWIRTGHSLPCLHCGAMRVSKSLNLEP